MTLGGGSWVGARNVHPLAEILLSAVDGKQLPVDGGWRRVPPWQHGLEAVLACTGHAVLVIRDDVADEELVALGVDGFGGAHDPRVMAALAGTAGWIDSLDLLLARRGTASETPSGALVARPDLSGHPRARFAMRLRERPRVLGYPEASRSAVAILSRGVAGLTELSFELEPSFRGTGGGLALVRDALGTVSVDEVVLAAVAPGNVASLRVLLSADFKPLASLQLFRRGG